MTYYTFLGSLFVASEGFHGRTADRYPPLSTVGIPETHSFCRNISKLPAFP